MTISYFQLEVQAKQPLFSNLTLFWMIDQRERKSVKNSSHKQKESFDSLARLDQYHCDN